jgi:hypothetical protein
MEVKKRLVLAISGWKGSGKDAMASYLVNNYKARRIAFADPLKDMVATEYGISRDYMDDPKHKEAPLLNLPVNPQDKFSKNVTDFMMGEFRDKNGNKATDSDGSSKPKMYWTPRALCILKGSINRSVDSSYWVKKAISVINEDTETDIFVVSDLRYKSEMLQLAEAFHEQVQFIRIERYESSPSNDPSERDLDDAKFNVTFYNKTTLNNFFEDIDSMMIVEGFKKDKK